MRDDNLGTFWQFYYTDGTRDDFPVEDEVDKVVDDFIHDRYNTFSLFAIGGRKVISKTAMICSISLSSPSTRENARFRDCLYDEANEAMEKKRKTEKPEWL